MPMTPPSDNHRDTTQDIAYLVVAGAAIFAAAKVWTSIIQPWLAEHVQAGTHTADGALVHVGSVSIAGADVAGVAILLVPVVVAAVMLRGMVKRRKNGPSS